MWSCTENIRQFIPSSMVLACHLNILLCITWKVRITEWTFAGRNVQKPLQQQEKTSRYTTFHSLSGHATCWCRHTLEICPSGWTETTFFFIYATLHNASLHCVGYTQCTSSHKLLQSKPSACSINHQCLLSESVRTCLALRPQISQQQTRTPAATTKDLHGGLEKVSR